MDRDTLGNLLFLSSLAAVSVGCAQGSEGPGPRPGPFVTGGGDAESEGDPWTDPLETSGGEEDPKPDDGTGGWPDEGETGQVSSGDSGGMDGDDTGGADSGAMETSGASATTGGEGYGSTSAGDSGYDMPVGDPCPALAQLYADCNPEYDYATEIQLCNQARTQAASISAACSLAHTEYLACLSTLSCGALLGGSEPLACTFQGAATDLACGG